MVTVFKSAPRGGHRAGPAVRLAHALRALCAFWFWAIATAANAQLVLTVSPLEQAGDAGATFLFSGTVTNETGAALTTSDLFLDFSGFDPAFLSPHQLLGSVVETIADGATSDLLPLFQLTLAASATPGPIYSADVMLQDAFGALSDPVTVSVSVVPEPAASSLLLISLVPLGLWAARRGTRTGRVGGAAS